MDVKGTERILIVDDQKSQRKKMSLAVGALGFSVETAEDGEDALDKLRSAPFDLVLLDIVMPKLDGFGVMDQMRQDSELCEIPVIVVSSLDTEMDSVVRAIGNGAQDFLPKDFQPVLLNARISASLERKRNRDREREYLREVAKLTEAATILEDNTVNPQRLALEDVSRRDDSLGRLARVFTRMAGEVYHRERRLRLQLRTMRGVLGLLFVGVIFGLWAPLSRIIAEEAPHPFGIAFWVNVICAVLCLGYGLLRGRLHRLNGQLILVYLMWGVLGTLIGEVFLFWVAQKLEAWIISLVIVTEGFMAFFVATILRVENASLRRFLGFAVGLVGVLLVMIATQNLEGDASWTWVLAALIAPLGFALRGILVAIKLPDDLDRVTATGYSALAAALILTPFLIVFDDFVPLSFAVVDGVDTVTGVVFLLGLISATACSMRVQLVKSAGAVFASQCSFAITVAGIGWGIILLGEHLPWLAWLALLLLVCGLILVGPKEEAEEVERIELPGKGDIAMREVVDGAAGD